MAIPLQRSVVPAPPNAATLAAIGVVAIVAGVATVYQPALVGGALVALCGLVLFRRLSRLFLGLLWILVLGYALLGRSVAYLGAPPVFVGEVMLGVGLVATLASGALFQLVRSPVAWLVVLWAGWGVACTLPSVGKYSTDALRDAVVWGYGAFALTVAACLLNTGALPDFVSRYRAWAIVLATWPLLYFVQDVLAGARGPNMPGTDVPLFSGKPGDFAVNLAGAAVFTILGLSGRVRSERSFFQRRWVFWTFWLLSLSTLAALSRGGFLAVMIALATVAVVEPFGVGKRVAAGAVAFVLAIAAFLIISLALDGYPEVASTTRERSFSATQLVENVLSITGQSSAGDLSDTRSWRLDWWGQIVDYTVFGRYFWTGKGFGVNLADDDGFQVATEDEAPLRSPHSVFMTVLARMGVPGFVLFMLLQLAFAASLLGGYWRARRAGAMEWARLNLWILAYWVAFLVNASFDVALEGPQAGIPFWSLVGVGIAALEMQRRQRERERLPRAVRFA